MKKVEERFIEYTKFNTKSDENSKICPSTLSQLEFGKYLVSELKEIGLKDCKIDNNGYVTALLPKNAEGFFDIGFIAHMDTSPDESGENVNALIIENYDGGIIERKGPSLSSKDFTKLLKYTGQRIITSDGTTLLGADNKAGIAEIITAMEYLINHKEIPHGDIKIGFTPDEEIGRGADLFNVKDFNCDFAYTIDGGEIGELEYENFNAARAKIEITGVNVHPGTAKGLMKNAVLIGTELASMLPENETPATTKNYEGFFHLISLSGNATQCSMSYIIRDFDKHSFENRKITLKDKIAKLNLKYNNIIKYDIYDEYYNMREEIEKNMHVVEIAKKAMHNCNITPTIKPIRGGTDGARLSFMGLPCPNIFTGGHNFHGIYEFIPIESMEKAVEVIIKISSSAKK